MAKNGRKADSGKSTKIIISYVVDLGRMNPLEHERLVSSAGVAVPSCMMLWLVSLNEEGISVSAQPAMAELFLSQLLTESDDDEGTLLTLKEWSGSSPSW